MKKAAVLLLACVLLGLCGCSKPEPSPTVQETVSTAAPVAAAANSAAPETVRFYKDIRFYEQWDNDTLLCRVEFPVLIPEGANSQLVASVDALNARLSSQAQETYTKLLNSVQADVELNVEGSSNYLNYTDAYVMRADSRALSLVFRTENYTRGIYDALSFTCANFDAATGRELALGQVASDVQHMASPRFFF